MFRSMVSAFGKFTNTILETSKICVTPVRRTFERSRSSNNVRIMAIASATAAVLPSSSEWSMPNELPFSLLPIVSAKVKDRMEDEIYPPRSPGKPPPSIPEMYNFIADIVEKTAPAVVRIEVDIKVFGARIAATGGSGFIVSPEGLVVTNAHVVANSTSCKVRLSDGTEYTGVVEAIDERTDLATIRIPGKHLPTIKLGISAKSRPGEWVVALGSPFHLSNSISHGIISSVSRHSEELGHWTNMSYIQTDAAINQGNSGGPLVNLQGEAIGVNSMKLSEGIAFAIPSDYVRDFLIQVEEKKKSIGFLGSKRSPTSPRRRWLGVTMLTLDRNQMSYIRAMHPQIPAVDSGVLIVKVVEGSPAQLAGLKPNDVIVSINTETITHVNQVYKALAELSLLTCKVRRGNQDLILTVYPEKLE